MSIFKMFRGNSPYSFILALVVGVALAASGSVWATSIGTNVTVTGTMTVSSATASSSVTTALGVATTTPGTTFSVVGSGYFTSGLGAGVATTTAGAIENSGNALFGDAAGDLVMYNSALSVYNNAGTTTIPSSSANGWTIATTTTTSLVKYDTSNTRVGISSSTPSATFSVGGNVALGNTSTHVLTINAGSIAYGNAGTTTIPSGSANSWTFATTTTTSLLKFDSSNTRVGISSSTPAATFSVGGDVALGSVSTHVLTINAGSIAYGNAGTTTIPSSSANAWTFATTTTTSLLKFDTTNTRVGISSSTPAATFSVGGNVALGNTSDHTVTVNAGSLVFGNAGTTTIPSANANAWSYATSTANIPFLKFDTSNTRVGISTTTPGATFSVGGGGNIYALGGLGVGLATTTAGAIENSGNALFGDAAGDLVMYNAANIRHNNAGTTTIPAGNANSWTIATSTTNAFLKFDTTNHRIGIGTSTPQQTLSVEGAGYFAGNVGIGTSTPSAALGVVGNIVVISGCVKAASTTATALLNACAAGAGGADLAETYEVAEEVASGDLLMVDDQGLLRKATDDSFLIGVVSSQPAIVFEGDQALFGASKYPGPASYPAGSKAPIALVGRVNVTVNLEGGSIKAGDRITVSSVPGVGKKAVRGDYIAGIALGSFSGPGQGQVLTFVK